MLPPRRRQSTRARSRRRVRPVSLQSTSRLPVTILNTPPGNVAGSGTWYRSVAISACGGRQWRRRDCPLRRLQASSVKSARAAALHPQTMPITPTAPAWPASRYGCEWVYRAVEFVGVRRIEHDAGDGLGDFLACPRDGTAAQCSQARGEFVAALLQILRQKEQHLRPAVGGVADQPPGRARLQRRCGCPCGFASPACPSGLPLAPNTV